MSGLVVSGAGCGRLAERLAIEVGGQPVPLGTLTEVPDRGTDRLVFVGCDAELAHLSGLLQSQGKGTTPVAYLGRDSSISGLFAHDESVGGVLARWRGGAEYPMDVGEVVVGGKTRRFVGWVAAGGAARRGLLFPWAASAGSVTVESDRSWTIERGRAVTVANAQEVGGWRVSPRAAVMDGRLDIQVLSGSAWGLARIRPAIRRGLHAGASAVWRRSLAKAAVVVPPGWPVVVDGMQAGRGSFFVGLGEGALVLLV